MVDLKALREASKGIRVLYVEDNDNLRKKAMMLLKKVFVDVHSASNGLIAYQHAKKTHYDLIITDIKMPKLDGIEMAKRIKKINPNVKVIITSAFDDKEYLLESIDLGISKFLKKPLNLDELTQALHNVVNELQNEQSDEVFNQHLKNSFFYQASMVLIVENYQPVFANDAFLDFFGCSDIDCFKKKYPELGKFFVAEDGLLHDTEDATWYELMEMSEKNFFNVKMKDSFNDTKQFLLKVQNVPKQQNQMILSFDDVSELKLVDVFNEESEVVPEENDYDKLFEILDVLQRNNAKVELHNYYRGLSITNPAIIVDISDQKLIVKTQYLQQKAIQIEEQSYLLSEAFPYTILCSGVNKISFEEKTVEFEILQFQKRTPLDRKTIRVEPEDEHEIKIYNNKHPLQEDFKIIDISLEGLKVECKRLPPGLFEHTEVYIEMDFEVDKAPPTRLEAKGVVFRKDEFEHSFQIVFLISDYVKNNLVKYITKRQMALIREIKGR